MTPTEQKAFDQMREALESITENGKRINSSQIVVSENVMLAAESALTAANAVGAPKACDMGAMCLDCQPRGKHGECPDQQPQAHYEEQPDGTVIPVDPSEMVPQAQGEAITLQRWGRAENLCLRLLDPMDDGYWTPWHIAQEAIDSLQRQLANPQATEPAIRESLTAQDVPAWRPIETAPKDGTLYLAMEGSDMWVENAPEGHFAGVWSWSESRRQWRGHAHSDDRFATHWMHLPAAPEAS